MYQSQPVSYNIPSPIESVHGDVFRFHLDVKREDLIHPLIKGNKYRKLKYNLKYYYQQNYHGIITFGGAYSNHLHATSSLTKLYGIPTVGIVRGEEVMENDVIDFCKASGMKIHQVARSTYKEKENHQDISSIIEHYKNHLLIPEGGSNDQAIQGVKEIVDELPIVYDFIALAAGTGCTAAGIIQRVEELSLPTKVIVFSALKGDWIKDEIAKHIGQYNLNRHYITDYYCQGGYAKVNEEYISKLSYIRQATNIPIDHVYNGKVLIGLKDHQDRGLLKDNHKVLWINSGGVI
jgi:1-aminocyclopropane-1-carboxylate deaminase